MIRASASELPMVPQNYTVKSLQSRFGGVFSKDRQLKTEQAAKPLRGQAAVATRGEKGSGWARGSARSAPIMFRLWAKDG